MNEAKKIRHKAEGWTGTIRKTNETLTYFASHKMGIRVDYDITQDAHKPDGEYVEDPSIDSLDELEFLD